MKSTGRIVGNNLLIFVLYTLVIHATYGNEAAITGSALAYMHAIGAVLIGIFMAIFNKEGERSQGGALVLAGLLIATIGSSVCLGTVDLKMP
jgi:hypothetical protein